MSWSDRASKSSRPCADASDAPSLPCRVRDRVSNVQGALPADASPIACPQRVLLFFGNCGQTVRRRHWERTMSVPACATTPRNSWPRSAGCACSAGESHRTAHVAEDLAQDALLVALRGADSEVARRGRDGTGARLAATLARGRGVEPRADPSAQRAAPEHARGVRGEPRCRAGVTRADRTRRIAARPRRRAAATGGALSFDPVAAVLRGVLAARDRSAHEGPRVDRRHAHRGRAAPPAPQARQPGSMVLVAPRADSPAVRRGADGADRQCCS